MKDFSTSPDSPVLCIGAAGLDIVGRLRGELVANTSSPAHIRTTFGGVARNVAENLARLGQEAILLSVVGDDQAGDQLLQNASQAGVTVDYVMRCSDKSTGSYLAIINAAGELQYALDDMRVMTELTPVYLHKYIDLIRQSSVIFIDTNLPKETIRTIFSLSRQTNKPVCADPTSRSLAMRLKPYLSRLSIITPNIDEAGILCDRMISINDQNEVLFAAKCLVSDGVDLVIITLGQYGLCYATSETSGSIPAIRTKIVDPTGAGDALTAAVLFALLNDIPLDDAVRLGVSAASLTLQHPGAVFPDLSLEKLYDHLVI